VTNIEIRLDGLFREGLDIEPAHLEQLAADRLPDVLALISRERQAGALRFLDLPDGGDLVETIRGFADGVGQAFENVAVLAAGGSAPGIRALLGTLLHPWWNELGPEYRDYYPRIFILDSIEPDIVGPFLRHVAPARTLYNVVSRSGTTPETASLYLTARAALEAELGEGYRRHFVFTTAEKAGAFRALAEAEGMASLPLPLDVSGSFSVFSAAGLLPAALAGIDVDALLAGARSMRERCLSDEFAGNPAASLAAALHLAQARLSIRTHVLTSFSERLADLGGWFRQLWSSTLGRRSGDSTAPRPVPAVAFGARDHFGQLEMFCGGPPEMLFLFLTVRDSREDLEIATGAGTPSGMESLGWYGRAGRARRDRTTGRDHRCAVPRCGGRRPVAHAAPGHRRLCGSPMGERPAGTVRRR